jgi:AI-2 transport protein TqsA
MTNTPPRPSDRRVQTACLVILTLIATGAALAQLQQVLVPFVIAILLTQCLTPLISYFMYRFRMPYMLAATVAVLAAAGMIIAVGFLLTSSISSFSQPDKLDPYRQRFSMLTRQLVNSRLAGYVGIKPGETSENLKMFQDQSMSVLKFVFSQMQAILTNTAVVLILMAFLIFGRSKLHRKRLGIMTEIEVRVQRYISLTVSISVLTGLLVGGSLWLMHVQFAAGFGFLAFLLNFIPNLGAVIATLLPLPFAFLDPHLHLWQAVGALVLPAAIQAGIGSFIQPRWMGYSLDLHPVVLLLSLLFFNMIWGVSGAFLAVPLTAVIKIVLEKIPATRPLAAALAGNLDPLAQTIETPVDPPAKNAA